MARPAARCRATTCASSTRTDSEVADGEVGELYVRGADRRRRLLEPARQKPRRPSRANGPAPATNTRATPTAATRYCGRADDMFKVSGIWVSPFEVEGALVAPSLRARSRGRAGDGRGQSPQAESLRGAASPASPPDGLDAELKDHVKAAIGLWKYPRWIEVRESLPKTATGKIQRFKLRDGA